jgi:hypothetical protein
MGSVSLDRPQALFFAQQLRDAYERARATNWDAAARTDLLGVTVEAVQAYLSQAPEDPEAIVYHTMLVDLLSQAPPSQFKALNETACRAARVAATRVLQNPKTPQHRPKSQNLLKRLDLLQNPLLQAREALLLNLTQRMRAEPEKEKVWGSARAGHYLITRRVSRVVGVCAVPDPDEPQAQEFAGALDDLRRLLDADGLDEPRAQAEIFVLLQVLLGVSAQDATLKAVGPALEHLADEKWGLDRVLRHAILHLIFQIDLSVLGRAERPAITQWFGRLPAVLKRLSEQAPDEQDAALMRMRHALMAPNALGLEQRLDEALTVLVRINARRDAVLARLARLEQSVDPLLPLDVGTKTELAHLRARLRRISRLRDALLGANLVSNSSHALALLPRLYQQLEALAGLSVQPEDEFNVLLADLRRQLESPQSAARPWYVHASDLLKRVLAALGENPREPGTTWSGESSARARATVEKTRVTLQLLTQGGQLGVDDERLQAWISDCVSGFDYFLNTGDDSLLAPVVGQMLQAISYHPRGFN